jgi:hypothetical protein
MVEVEGDCGGDVLVEDVEALFERFFAGDHGRGESHGADV